MAVERSGATPPLGPTVSQALSMTAMSAKTGLQIQLEANPLLGPLGRDHITLQLMVPAGRTSVLPAVPGMVTPAQMSEPMGVRQSAEQASAPSGLWTQGPTIDGHSAAAPTTDGHAAEAAAGGDQWTLAMPLAGNDAHAPEAMSEAKHPSVKAGVVDHIADPAAENMRVDAESVAGTTAETQPAWTSAAVLPPRAASAEATREGDLSESVVQWAHKADSRREFLAAPHEHTAAALSETEPVLPTLAETARHEPSQQDSVSQNLQRPQVSDKDVVLVSDEQSATIREQDPASIGGPYYGGEPAFRLDIRKKVTGKSGSSKMQDDESSDQQRRSRCNAAWQQAYNARNTQEAEQPTKSAKLASVPQRKKR